MRGDAFEFCQAELFEEDGSTEGEDDAIDGDCTDSAGTVALCYHRQQVRHGLGEEEK